MATLHVRALGRLRVCLDEVPLSFPTKKAQHLLCYLLLRAGTALERDQVAEQLWPERPPGRACRSLSTAVWRLRQTIDGPGQGQSHLLTRRGTLAFDTARVYWFDVQAFEQRATFGLQGPLPCPEDRSRALEQALELYQGDFLEGSYDDWCLVERERLQLQLLRVVKRLQRHYRLTGAFQDAIAAGQRLLALDPLQEDVYRELMRCYDDAGQRPMALAQFQRCREALSQELRVEPMPRTWQLYREIRGGQGRVRVPVTGERASLQQALAQFRRALDSVESAWQALQAVAMEMAERGRSATGDMS